MGQSDAEYYAARALVERRLSAQAHDVRAARAHTILAERYQALAAGSSVARRSLHLVNG